MGTLKRVLEEIGRAVPVICNVAIINNEGDCYCGHGPFSHKFDPNTGKSPCHARKTPDNSRCPCLNFHVRR